MTERLCHTGTHNESAHAHIQGVRTQPLRGSNTSTRFVTLLFPAMDADSIHFAQAKEATEQMVLRELHEHVCVGPMPSGAINITNLPIRSFLSEAPILVILMSHKYTCTPCGSVLCSQLRQLPYDVIEKIFHLCVFVYALQD